VRGVGGYGATLYPKAPPGTVARNLSWNLDAAQKNRASVHARLARQAKAWKIPAPKRYPMIPSHHRTHEYSVPVSELDASGRAYRFPVRSAWLLGALEDHEAVPAGSDGTLEIRLSKSGSDVVLHGKLDADLTMPCARCLVPVPIPLRLTVSTLFVPRGKVAAKGKGDDEVELSPEDADMVTYDGDTVVLDEWVRDELILETPMIPLCSEDCPGMSPDPAIVVEQTAEASIDPRLLPLLKLKKS
jgi:uncharacterized protein